MGTTLNLSMCFQNSKKCLMIFNQKVKIVKWEKNLICHIMDLPFTILINCSKEIRYIRTDLVKLCLDFPARNLTFLECPRASWRKN